MKKVDIIVPVKDEAQNIQALVQRIDVALQHVQQPYRIIVVDDHSSDGTDELLVKLATQYPIITVKKKGQPGKGFSILEGAHHATSDFVVIIDGDLQYPPEAIPEMLEKTKQYEVVVAKRQSRHEPMLRQMVSQTFRFFFCRLLFGFRCDVQSGLKVFRRDILTHILSTDVTGWTLDLPLLYTANELGYRIGEVNIEFGKRTGGSSKINVLRSIAEIGGHALHFKFKFKRPLLLLPKQVGSMIGAGIIHKKKRFVTHTTLPYHQSAIHTFTPAQKVLLTLIIGLVIAGFFFAAIPTLKFVIAILSFIYFIDVFFNLFVISRSLHQPPEIGFSDEELKAIDDSTLPVYTILCPLYKEGRVLPHFVSAIEKLDWPKDKLDVLLLLEEDDTDTIEAANELKLPSYIRPLVVPDSQPKTKPKACNYGLSHATGKYLVIYDAEDQPDPMQLKKAHLAFSRLPNKVKCLQAKLNYFNPHQNLLTRFFTVEYSLWFDVMLTGLQSVNTVIPLGGTSNHFKTADLRRMHGWDPFNVTEDCDLGVRLFKHGYQTAIIDSVTLEEANSRFINWMRQRSRWIKGYMQTFFIHMRHPVSFFRQHGTHALLFQLTVGGKIAFMLINPLMWLLTISYFVLRSLVGPTIETFFPTAVYFMALTSLIVGNFLFVYYYMIGAAKHGQWNLIKFVFLEPIYWLMVSGAACIALYQLIVKPHYWEKTNHGLHLAPVVSAKRTKPQHVTPQAAPQREPEPVAQPVAQPRPKTTLPIGSGSVFIAASLISYLLNFAYNAYLGRSMSLTDFGTITLIGTFLYLAQVLFTAFAKTVSYHSSFLLGKYQVIVTDFWKVARSKGKFIGILFFGAWCLAIPQLTDIFHLQTALPLVLFAPIWTIGLAASIDSGFLNGQLQFAGLGMALIIEALAKLTFAVVIVALGFPDLIYLALPLSMFIGFIYGRLIIWQLPVAKVKIPSKLIHHFPKQFFMSTLVSRLSGLAYLSLDILLVKTLLAPDIAGQYALLSLTGKMVYFVGTLFASFIIPIVGKAQGAKSSSRVEIAALLSVTTLTTIAAGVALGPLGYLTVPLLFGEKALTILPYLTTYIIGMACFTVASNLVTYYQARRVHIVSFVTLLVSVAQIIALVQFGSDLGRVVQVMQWIGIANLGAVLLSVLLLPLFRKLQGYGLDLFWLFSSYKPATPPDHKLRFLVFNWRDTKHSWAGGAEVYIHEIAKQWVKQGHRVTVFCGNDGHHARNEMIDGVQMVRRGGFFSVYVWAFLYYTLRFKGRFDIVIDCENGIPFFTPLYVQEPISLLIFHVHQQVFREHLRFPLSLLAQTLESRLMPLVYRNQKVVTISQSTQEELISLGLTKPKRVEVIEPGIYAHRFELRDKTSYPSFLYLGRLKPYKNVDIVIRSFVKVIERYPTARLTIAGTGESRRSLEALTRKLRIGSVVRFVGKVSEEQKTNLLGQTWAALQPSSIEGWGITVIEANACGTPVIASNVSGLKDSVVPDKTGILVQSKNIKAFTKAMIELIENHEKRATLSKSAHQWSQHFSWKTSAEKYYKNVHAQLSEAYVQSTWPQ